MKANRNYLILAVVTATALTGLGQPAPPGLIRQPANQKPYIGSAATLSVAATGSPPPTYQWRFNGTDLLGKTNNSLSLVDVQFTNAGPYSVAVRNDSGSVTSEKAWLSVLPTNVVNLGDRELSFGELSAPIWEASRIDDEGQTVTGDGLTLFYGSSAPGGSGDLDIWMVTRARLSSPWGTPVNLGPTVNSSAIDTEPRLSPDGLSLYFGSTRPGGRGGYDIWVSTRPTLGAPFGVPVNLGAAINGSADDDAQQISADNLTLVFGSTRSGGLGTYDIYISSRTNALAPWEPARHLDAPINSSGGTFPVELSRDGLLLFFKSWRPNSAGSEDTAIYVTRRPSQDKPFGTPVLVRPILSFLPAADWCSISDDGTRLYVGTYRKNPQLPQLRQISITALPQLTAPRGIAHGEFQFELMGREGASYEIEVSPDLSTWTPWLTTNTTGSLTLSDSTSSAQESRHFYRALSH